MEVLAELDCVVTRCGAEMRKAMDGLFENSGGADGAIGSRSKEMSIKTFKAALDGEDPKRVLMEGIMGELIDHLKSMNDGLKSMSESKECTADDN